MGKVSDSSLQFNLAEILKLEDERIAEERAAEEAARAHKAREAAERAKAERQRAEAAQEQAREVERAREDAIREEAARREREREAMLRRIRIEAEAKEEAARQRMLLEHERVLQTLNSEHARDVRARWLSALLVLFAASVAVTYFAVVDPMVTAAQQAEVHARSQLERMARENAALRERIGHMETLASLAEAPRPSREPSDTAGGAVTETSPREPGRARGPGSRPRLPRRTTPAAPLSDLDVETEDPLDGLFPNQRGR